MPSLLDRVRDKLAGVARPVTRLLRKTRHTIATNRFDDRVWAETRKLKPVDQLIADLTLGDEHQGGTRRGYEPAPELVHDLFMALYKAAPRLTDAKDVDLPCYPNHKIVEELLANERLVDLQQDTASDPVMSAIALQTMGEEVKAIIGRIPPPPPPPAPAGDQGDQQPGDEQQPGDQPGGGCQRPDCNGEPEDGCDHTDGPSEQQQAEQEWRDAFDEQMGEVDLERAVMRAVDEASKETGGLEALRDSYGLADGEWQTMSPEQRLEFAAVLRTPEMRQLANIVGRMRRYSLGVRATRVVDVPHEIHDVRMGNDLRHVLPSQFALLADETTRYEFYRRYADRQLLQFRLRGTEEVGRGPVVICIDKSSSMNARGKFHWAMAVAESLRRFALDDGRDYLAIFFGTNRDRHRFSFPGGRAPFAQVLQFLSAKANGGTEFNGVLDEALEAASKAFDGSGAGKADIVFVTDGVAALSDPWIAAFNTERARVGVRVFSVFVSGADDMAGRPAPLELLERISDVVIPVGALKPEAVRDVFSHV